MNTLIATLQSIYKLSLVNLYENYEDSLAKYYDIIAIMTSQWFENKIHKRVKGPVILPVIL